MFNGVKSEFSGIDGKWHAEGQHIVLQPVAEGHVGEDGEVEGFDLIHDHLPNGGDLAAVRKAPENQSRKPVENTGEFELGKHTVQTVERFSAVFHEQDGSGEVREIGCSQQVCEAGEIASDYRPGRRSMPEDVRWRKFPAKLERTAQCLQYTVESFRAIHHAGEVRAVKGGPPELLAKKRGAER